MYCIKLWVGSSCEDLTANFQRCEYIGDVATWCAYDFGTCRWNEGQQYWFMYTNGGRYDTQAECEAACPGI